MSHPYKKMIRIHDIFWHQSLCSQKPLILRRFSGFVGCPRAWCWKWPLKNTWIYYLLWWPMGKLGTITDIQYMPNQTQFFPPASDICNIWVTIYGCKIIYVYIWYKHPSRFIFCSKFHHPVGRDREHIWPDGLRRSISGEEFLYMPGGKSTYKFWKRTGTWWRSVSCSPNWSALLNYGLNMNETNWCSCTKPMDSPVHVNLTLSLIADWLLSLNGRMWEVSQAKFCHLA